MAKFFYSSLLLSALTLVFVLGLPGGNIQQDSENYRWLAEGKFNLVLQPFSSRGLEPAIVRLTDHILGTPPDLIFYFLSALSVACCIGGTAFIAARTINNKWLFVLPFLPIWTILFHAYLLPDIFHAGLLTIFCLLLARQKYVAAALMFAPLCAARESSSMVLVCFAAALIGLVKFRITLLAFASAILGFAVEKWLVVGTLGNRYGVSQFAYLVGKAPYNILKNIAGFSIWTNVLHVCQPTSVYSLPHWKILGANTTIGPCPWDPNYPIVTLLLFLGTFGILPVLLVTSLRGRWTSDVKQSVFLRFCISYGVISFLIGPALGATMHRYFAYGWPAFALALPILTPDLFQQRRDLLIVHSLVSWFTWIVYWQIQFPPWVLLAIAANLSAWVFAFLTTRKRLEEVQTI